MRRIDTHTHTHIRSSYSPSECPIFRPNEEGREVVENPPTRCGRPCRSRFNTEKPWLGFKPITFTLSSVFQILKSFCNFCVSCFEVWVCLFSFLVILVFFACFFAVNIKSQVINTSQLFSSRFQSHLYSKLLSHAKTFSMCFWHGAADATQCVRTTWL